ncbi:MAG: hypothetical protein E6I78_13190 [Chloroflexi bacterium]|nr:MAG: hypothetical protein E6I78_13190 [Chloroflexota bacterium]
MAPVKGIRPKVGDVFEVPINESQVGYGQVAAQRLQSYLMAIFKTAYRRGQRPELSRITADDIAFLGESLDAKIWNGDWVIVGNLPPDRSRIPLPTYKVTVGDINSWFVESYDGSRRRPATPNELNVLELRTVVAPIRLEKALQALHGARPWEPTFRQLEYDRVKRSGEIP